MVDTSSSKRRRAFQPFASNGTMPLKGLFQLFVSKTPFFWRVTRVIIVAAPCEGNAPSSARMTFQLCSGCNQSHPIYGSPNARTSDFHERRRRPYWSGRSLVCLQLPQSPASSWWRSLQLHRAVRELCFGNDLCLSFRCGLNAHDPPARLKTVGLRLGAVDKSASCDEGKAHSRFVLLGCPLNSLPPIFKILINLTL